LFSTEIFITQKGIITGVPYLWSHPPWTSKDLGGSVDTDSSKLITKLCRTKVTNLQNKKRN